MDIEACLLSPDNPCKAFADFIQKLSSDYFGARSGLKMSNSLFDTARPAAKEEFARYLIISDRYEAEQLPEIFLAETPEILIDLAARGYKDKFFEKLNSAVDMGYIKLEEIKAFNIDWSRDCFSGLEMRHAGIFRDRVCGVSKFAIDCEVGRMAEDVTRLSGVVQGESKAMLSSSKLFGKLFQYHFPRR